MKNVETCVWCTIEHTHTLISVSISAWICLAGDGLMLTHIDCGKYCHLVLESTVKIVQNLKVGNLFLTATQSAIFIQATILNGAGLRERKHQLFCFVFTVISVKKLLNYTNIFKSSSRWKKWQIKFKLFSLLWLPSNPISVSNQMHFSSFLSHVGDNTKVLCEAEQSQMLMSAC